MGFNFSKQGENWSNDDDGTALVPDSPVEQLEMELV